MVVEDSGVGMKHSVDMDNPGSMSLKIVSILTRQLKDKIEVDTQPRTKFVIQIPKIG